MPPASFWLDLKLELEGFRLLELEGRSQCNGREQEALHFGRPLLPFQRIRREYYQYQEQPPSDHIENLHRYLLIASSLIPRDPWEGETLALKVALIEATENWETLAGGGPPCPVVFDAEDVRGTMELDAETRGADETLEACRNMIGFGPEGWMPAEHYEAMARSKKLKEDGLAAAESEEERAQVAAHWPLDEEEYM
ncbi:uncharacterized protein LAESUDRAFT_756575 [Laetiporus sulphureus 93-53]|uniref:Uncharacterized protein n=1 Tax=Laetiporus sulphureus 93-53 TaxID=1314785 RepID=A0A165FZT8_9APHY|nr:uncharacterized protein LAESUDRAFT_756575 [Laetiporus sulphureus 93-53]KZT09637.1 hypothetical protein LAESUDRAFT_756575 [Laetiporus sulphureus 93-53]